MPESASNESSVQPAAKKPDMASALKWLGVAGTVISVTLGGRQLVNAYTDRRDKREAVGRHLAAATLEQSAGAMAAAWTHLDSAAKIDPRDERTRRARERLAMQWLDRFDFVGEQSDPATLAARLAQPLAEGVARASGVDRADMLAHLAWSAFLRDRSTGTSGLDSLLHQAIAVDSINPFAHAMLGFFALREGHVSRSEVRAHFERALASGREAPLVRRLRYAALLNAADRIAGVDAELVRVANDARKSNQMPDAVVRSRIFSAAYFSQMRSPRERERMLGVLPPEEHLQTFRWLYATELADSTGGSPEHLMIDALLADRAGRREDARASYQRLLTEAGESIYATLAREQLGKTLRAR